ncbi:MAG: hypothetical protein KOO66_14045 [Bacteroidales bacterium]|nr:hypothetical protein [Bacteroidales bacterium]
MKYFVTLLICLSALYVSAQKIENLKIDQNGGEIIIQYDINGTINNNFKVSIYYSTDNKKWDISDKAYGDTGDSVIAGQAKKVVIWLDHLNNLKDKMYFKLIAEYYTVDSKKEGNLTDKNENTYSWIRYGKNKWMTQNLKANKSDGDCGGLFTNTDALKACPDDWYLPSDEDWMELEIEFGVNKVKEHGLREIKLNELGNTGFILEECEYKASLYPNQKAVAFWTSSQNKMLYTGYSDKYFARIIRLDENKISKELRTKSEELSVRCVQNATYLASIEAVSEKQINLSQVSGTTNHTFTGEKLEWIYVGEAIWLKNDIAGSYVYKEVDGSCPAGWRLPEKEEWEMLFMELKPSVKSENQKNILSERLSTSGAWSMNLSNNDYWMNTDYYTYNTYWINKKDKKDSKKLISFPTNKKGEAGWNEKQTNEKAKVRCILDNKDYINKRELLKTGTLIDKRDQKEYGVIELENKTWMSENLKHDLGENSSCRNDIKADCELFGYMYNVEVVNSGCPDGWRIPTSAEWKYLLINKAANNLKILYPFGGTGFNLLFGGEVIYDEENKTEIYTAKYLFNDGDKTGFYFINSNGKVELNEKAKKKDYYYVRCIQEVSDRF